MTLLQRLLQEFPQSKREKLKRLVAEGRILVNGRVDRLASRQVLETDKVEMADAPLTPRVAAPFPIIYEDADILVINKPAGMLTSTVPREKRPTAWAMVQNYLQASSPKSVPGLIHRLDRDASGLLIFTKNEDAFESLKAQFFHHTVSRIYLARVSPPPKVAEGRIEGRLVEWKDGTVHVSKLNGPVAITEYSTVKVIGNDALLRLKLETGRKHQIRVQLAHMGCPITGDAVYGGQPSGDGMQLAAVELEIDHPRMGKRMTFKINPPESLHLDL